LSGGGYSLFLDGSEVVACGNIGGFEPLTPNDVLSGIAVVSAGADHAVAPT
jgi:hypothetical protein